MDNLIKVLNGQGIKVNDRRRVSMGGSTKRRISQIKYIARHHSGVNVDQTMQILEGYWKNAHGWKTGGYNVVVHMDGSVDLNYDYDTVSNGVGNHNTNSFHISVLGNGKFTAAAEKSFYYVTKEVQRKTSVPNENVLGHNEFSGHQWNTCPGINMNAVRSALKNNHQVGGEKVTPETNFKPLYKQIKVGQQATHWQTGSVIPKFVKGAVYDVLREEAANQSISHKKLLIGKGDVPTGWLLEQDVDGFKRPAAAPSKPTPSKPKEPVKATGNATIKEIQANVGSKQDGWDGPNTRRDVIRLYQRFIGTNDDGMIGYNSLQKVRQLSIGYIGWDVYAVQAMLYLKGYGIVGKPDKSFGKNTRAALMAFQSKHGLLADGIAGAKTIAKLLK